MAQTLEENRAREGVFEIFEYDGNNFDKETWPFGVELKNWATRAYGLLFDAFAEPAKSPTFTQLTDLIAGFMSILISPKVRYGFEHPINNHKLYATRERVLLFGYSLIAEVAGHVQPQSEAAQSIAATFSASAANMLDAYVKTLKEKGV